MLKPGTLRRQMRELRKLIDNKATDEAIRNEAYHYEVALQWALGGCDWSPLSTLSNTERREE